MPGTAAGGGAVDPPSGEGSTHRRIVDAAYGCMARDGIAAATVESIARDAGVSRATVYRAFPGGRDELATAAVTAGVTQFLAGLRADIGDAPDLATMLERGLVAGRHRLDEHAVLQRALHDEPDQIVPLLATVLPLVLGVLRSDLAARLEHEDLRPERRPRRGRRPAGAARRVVDRQRRVVGHRRSRGGAVPGPGAPPRRRRRRLTRGASGVSTLPKSGWTMRRIRAIVSA